MLERAGYRLRGAHLLVHGEVPIGAGLSSSAAIEVATGLALLGISGLDMQRVELAKLCQDAENGFVGARCGIMDQVHLLLRSHRPRRLAGLQIVGLPIATAAGGSQPCHLQHNG